MFNTRSRKQLLPFLTKVESRALIITERDHGDRSLRLCIQIIGVHWFPNIWLKWRWVGRELREVRWVWKLPQMELFFTPQRLRMLEDVEFQVGLPFGTFMEDLLFQRSPRRQSALPSLLSFSDFTLRQYQMAWNKSEFSCSSGVVPTHPGTFIYFSEKDLDLRGTAQWSERDSVKSSLLIVTDTRWWLESCCWLWLQQISLSSDSVWMPWLSLTNMCQQAVMSGIACCTCEHWDLPALLFPQEAQGTLLVTYILHHTLSLIIKKNN